MVGLWGTISSRQMTTLIVPFYRAAFEATVGSILETKGRDLAKSPLLLRSAGDGVWSCLRHDLAASPRGVSGGRGSHFHAV